MKKRFSFNMGIIIKLLIFQSLYASLILAQSKMEIIPSKMNLIPYYDGNRWGLCDIEKNIVVEPNYENIDINFPFNCVTVALNQKLALCSSINGELLTKFEYDEILRINPGMLVPSPIYFKVKILNKYGLIDTTGKTILIPDYDEIELSKDNSFKYFITTLGGKKRLVTGESKIFTKRDYDKIKLIYNTDFDNEQNPFKVIWIAVVLGNKIGLLNLETGEELTEIKYDLSIEYHSPTVSINYFPFEISDEVGVLNRSGIEIIPPKYSSIEYIGDNLFVMKRNKKVGAIDSLNRVVIPFEYDRYMNGSPDSRQKEVGFKLRKGETNFYFNTDGSKMPRTEYSDADYLSVMKHFLIKRLDKYLFVDLNGNTIKKFDYKKMNVVYREEWDFEYLRFFENEKCGLIDTRNWKILNSPYENLEPLTGNFIRTQLNGKYGVIDTSGKLIVPAEYDFLYQSTGSKFIYVRLNDKWGCFDQFGDMILNVDFDGIDDYEKQELFIARLKNKFALYDFKGRRLVDFIYDSIWQIQLNNKYYYGVKLGNKEGLLDQKFNHIIPLEYGSIENLAYPIYRRLIDDRILYYNLNGIKYFEN